ncbi:Squalene epoxidase [Kappamyces sp. JEL0680]|nr:Squalene epoxidase [Kappamyces sp. JEL0680]
MFREFGQIVRADVLKNEDGRSKGCGVVTYESSRDAQRAIDRMDGTTLDGRRIEVREDRFVGGSARHDSYRGHGDRSGYHYEPREERAYDSVDQRPYHSDRGRSRSPRRDRLPEPQSPGRHHPSAVESMPIPATQDSENVDDDDDGKHVLLVERDWSEPDRIVGELLQPGGLRALEKMGMLDCLDGIDGIRVGGYAVFKAEDDQVVLPYPQDGKICHGVAFHHGKFIMKLREKAKSCANVTCIEGTATELIQTAGFDSYLGAAVKHRKDGQKYHYFAPLTVVADGCFSAFRKQFISKPVKAKSHFAGLVLKDCVLPHPNHGHVVLAKPGPILLYQIGTHDTRLLVDIPNPLPKTSNGDMLHYMRDFVGPQLPSSVQESYYQALESSQIRSMPCSWLPPSQNTTEGAILLGDAQNMRHPLTGGGMTVAFWDVYHLSQLLRSADLGDPRRLQRTLASLHWKRKDLSSVVNILANALYELFSANDHPYIIELQKACFAYFQLGGICVTTPVGLLAGIITQPGTLMLHFFAVALYGIVLMLSSCPLYMVPYQIVKSAMVLGFACTIFFPLLAAEFAV